MKAQETLLGVVVNKLRNFDDSGSTSLQDGTLLIRENPLRRGGLFSDSYLHEIYRGLQEDQIGQLQVLIGRDLPEDLWSFYQEANGMSLFAGSLSIQGLRKNYSRDSSVRLPISLEYGNVLDTPHGQAKEDISHVRFGFYSSGDGAEVAIKLDGGRTIYAFPRYELKPVLFEWPDFGSMLLSEIDRMSDLFKKCNGDIDSLNPLPPPWEK
ncbi:MAG: hypothetical protein ACOH1Q_03985 [Thiobacillus sp.]